MREQKLQPSAPTGLSLIRNAFATRWGALPAAWRWALRLWAGFEAAFIVWCAWVSSAYPKFAEEAAVGVWSPAPGIATWLERVVLLPLLRYDVIWYVGIAQYGYGYRDGATAFHPLFPGLMAIAGRLLGGSYGAYLLAGWAIAQVCTVCMLALLYELVCLDYGEQIAQRTTVFLLASPLGFAFLIPYTEPLLLLCIVAALLAARRGRWWLAGLAGAGAALTKQPGLVVALPMLWELWRSWRRAEQRQPARALARPLMGLALTPLGLLAWLGYRATLGDVAISLAHPFSLVDTLLVTPTYKDIWGEYFSWPWVNFGYALDQLRDRPYFYLIVNLFVMLIMLAIALVAALRLRTSYAIYAVALVVMNLSIVYPLWPYMGIIRRFTIIFPIFIQLALWRRARAVTPLVLTLSALLWTLISSMYVRNAFVP